MRVSRRQRLRDQQLSELRHHARVQDAHDLNSCFRPPVIDHVPLDRVAAISRPDIVARASGERQFRQQSKSSREFVNVAVRA